MGSTLTLVCSACGAVKRVAADAVDIWLGLQHRPKLCARPAGKPAGKWQVIGADDEPGDEPGDESDAPSTEGEQSGRSDDDRA